MEAMRSSLPSAPLVTLYSSSALSRRTRRLVSSLVLAISVGEGLVWCPVISDAVSGRRMQMLSAISCYDSREETLYNCLAPALCMNHQV